MVQLTKKNSGRNTKAKILIVDDHPVLRNGLSRLIDDEKDLRVCAQAEGVSDAARMIGTHHPDLIIVDLGLKDGSGLDLIKQLKSQRQSVKVLVLSMFDEALYAPRVFRAGASGFVGKGESPDKILLAIRTVLQGKHYLSNETNERLLLSMFDKSVQAGGSPLTVLSDREMQVFEMIGQGLGTREISERLFLSAKTIESHRDHIKSKLGLADSREVARYAILWIREQA